MTGENKTPPVIEILFLGSQNSTYFELKKHLGVIPFRTQKYDMDALMTRLDSEPAVVICSEPPEKISLMEVAQAIRMTYPTCTIYYASTLRNEFNRKNLLKNGFTDAFLLPGDSPLFEDALKHEIARASKGKIKHYRAVKLLDLAPGTKLNFDVHIHLPLNHKYIKFSKSGEVIDELRLQRLEKKEKNSIHVASDQMSEFYKYAASQLKTLGDENLSETERQERRQNMVRELMSGMFAESTTGEVDTFSQGKEILKDCQEIIKSYVIGSDDGKNNWYKTIIMTAGGKSSAYSHAVNTSTYAALFSIGLGIGKPEDLALAGLLHDVGLTMIPPEIQAKKEEQRTPEEQQIYLSHAEKSVEIIKAKKMIVSEDLYKIILQHHEKFDPAQATKIHLGAQVLSLASYFDELTSAQDGTVAMTPLQALEKITKESIGQLDAPRFNPELVLKLQNVFKGDGQSGKAA